MHKKFLSFATVFGLFSVVLGAFGAHGLQKMVTDEKLIHGFQTGVQYQMYHSLALLATGMLFEKNPVKYLRWAGNLFITGIIFFSGSLYLLTSMNGKNEGFAKIVGPVTPIGGALLIAGWLFLLISILKWKVQRGD